MYIFTLPASDADKITNKYYDADFNSEEEDCYYYMYQLWLEITD